MSSTSSSSYSLVILQRGLPIAELEVTPLELPARAMAHHAARTVEAIDVRLAGPPHPGPRRLRLGDLIVLELAESGTAVQGTSAEWLRDLCGEAVLSLEMRDLDGGWVDLVELALPLDAPAELEQLYERLITELEQIHAGLASDCAGRVRQTRGAGPRRTFQPELEHRRLTGLFESLTKALDRIGVQPSTELVRTRTRARWRAGDRVNQRFVADLAREGQWCGKRPVSIERANVVRASASLDLAEHRQLRAGLDRLAVQARELAAGCGRAAELIEAERRRWGGVSRDHTRRTVFDQRYLPRQEKLLAIQRSTLQIASRTRATIRRYPFLAEAGVPRRPLRPTPLFLSRPGYIAAYQALCEARRNEGGLADGLPLRIRLRGLAELFEYWVFITVVQQQRARLGPPAGTDAFSLIDNVYRPELRPGQMFRWVLPEGQLLVVYEPEIAPAHWRDPVPFGWRASLTEAPLRPDVVVLVRSPGTPDRALILDAKSTGRFTRERLFDVSDYRTLIHDTGGLQPVRELWLVHRDRRGGTMSSLPEGMAPAASTSVLGAVAAVPGEVEGLGRVVVRFLNDDRLPLFDQA